MVGLWLGPWSRRSKLMITLFWFVLWGPATFFYVNLVSRWESVGVAVPMTS